jgi:hypothetical protein
VTGNYLITILQFMVTKIVLHSDASIFSSSNK